MDFEVGEGATLPAVTATAPGTFDGSETVTFRLRRPGDTTWTTLTAEFRDAPSGIVEHNWSAGETDTPGYHIAQFEITSTTDVTVVQLVGLIRGITYDPGALGLVGVEDIAAQKGRDLDSREVLFLEGQLPVLQSQLEVRLNRTLTPVTVVNEEHLVDYSSPFVYRWDWPGEFVPLRKTPVHSVTGVTIDGVTLASTAWRPERSGITLFELLTNASQNPPAVVKINYVGGFESGHPSLSAARDAITNVAVRQLNRYLNDDAAGAKNMSVEGYSVTYDDDNFTDADLSAVRRYRKRVAT